MYMITIKKDFSSLTEAKEEFLLDCKVKNLSKSTIKNYDECFTYFINYINNTFENFNLKLDMSKSVVSGYIMELKSKGLKDSTINIRIRAIRCVLYYLMRNEYINYFKISEIKENNIEIELYTDNEIQQLLKKPNMKKCSFAEYRTWVIINFLVATGVPKRKPRDSGPIITSGSYFLAALANSLTVYLKASLSAKSGLTSLKEIPSFGKPSTTAI